MFCRLQHFTRLIFVLLLYLKLIYLHIRISTHILVEHAAKNGLLFQGKQEEEEEDKQRSDHESIVSIGNLIVGEKANLKANLNNTQICVCYRNTESTC